MTQETLKKLAQLLEQDQFELILPENVQPDETKTEGEGTRGRDIRLVYLMNDAVESFLVFRNARMTGEYHSEYQGQLQASMNRQADGYVLVVRQGATVLTLFFEDLDLEVHLYEYAYTGHFWVKGQENLRVLEYQIAILRDKYEYLGAMYCTEDEQRLSSLKNFPPLNYLFYPSVPEAYIVSMEEPWAVSVQAVDVMVTLAREVHDNTFLRCLLRYSRKPTKRKAAQLASMLQKSRHSMLTECLADKVRQAANVYPSRDFGEEKNMYLQILWEKASGQQETPCLPWESLCSQPLA